MSEATAFVTKESKTWRLVSPSGATIEVSAPVFAAFEEALGLKHNVATIEITVRRGGIAGVEIRKVLKS